MEADSLEAISDDELRLIFTCCHPALTLESQVALTLKVVAGFTTSGRSQSVVRGLAAGRRAGATTVLFGGGTAGGGPAAADADFALIVPSTTTARVQEMHLLLLHALSEGVDAWAAGEASQQGTGG